MVEHVTFNHVVLGSIPSAPTKSAILALLLAFSGCASHQVANPEKCKDTIVASELSEYARLCGTLKLARSLVRKKEWVKQIEESLKKCEYVFGEKFRSTSSYSSSSVAER